MEVLRDEDFDHKLQQMSSFFSSDLHKFKLETQLKTLTHIVDEKQVGIKDAIIIISSLKVSQKLLVFEVLKLVIDTLLERLYKRHLKWRDLFVEVVCVLGFLISLFFGAFLSLYHSLPYHDHYLVKLHLCKLKSNTPLLYFE